MPPRGKHPWYEASSTYRAIYDEGFRQGLEEARARGRVVEALHNLLTLGTDQFGAPHAVIAAALERIDDTDALHELARGVLGASSWYELLTSASDIIPGLMLRPRVLLLGTGGAVNECRHQACLLVERADPALPPILLDTGNGLDVVRALLKADIDPMRVQDIFVSHRHADHAGGLDPLLLWRRVQMLKAGRPQTDAAARVYAEPRVVDALGRFFEATASTTPDILGAALDWKLLVDGQPVALPGGGQLVPFLVDHAPADGGSLGCVLEIDGVKIAYSGDTRPCSRLVEAVRGADVLFHEAGGLDADAENIHMIAHSTAGDAGRAARAAGVGRLYLTHLADEESAEALLAEARAAFGGPVDLAVDHGVVEI